MTDKNIFSIHQGGKESQDTATPVREELPVFRYEIEFLQEGCRPEAANGFLVFTSAHIAVMRDTPDGAVPEFVVPLSNVRSVRRVEI